MFDSLLFPVFHTKVRAKIDTEVRAKVIIIVSQVVEITQLKKPFKSAALSQGTTTKDLAKDSLEGDSPINV